MEDEERPTELRGEEGAGVFSVSRAPTAQEGVALRWGNSQVRGHLAPWSSEPPALHDNSVGLEV